MGLEAVDILVEIEERFQIVILDPEVEELGTIGELATLVHGLLPAPRASADACPTARVYYLLRRVMVDEVGIDRSRVRPETLLEELFPEPGRRAAWAKLNEVGVPLARLSWRGQIPTGLETVGSTVERLARNHPTLSGTPVQAREVESTILDIVSEQLGIERNRLSPETRWAELGI